jgi:transposase
MRPDQRAGTMFTLSVSGTCGERLNLAALYAWLVAEHDYTGSLRSVERFVRAHYPRPRVRARRRVETPPGAQAQADWAEFPRARIRDAEVDLRAFLMALSWSRKDALVGAGGSAGLAR